MLYGAHLSLTAAGGDSVNINIVSDFTGMSCRSTELDDIFQATKTIPAPKSDEISPSILPPPISFHSNF